MPNDPLVGQLHWGIELAMNLKSLHGCSIEGNTLTCGDKWQLAVENSWLPSLSLEAV
jgi:hypothetical protein